MDKKLLIFDLDGTLSDTQPILYTIVLETLRECGIELSSLADIYTSLEEHGKEVIELNALITAEHLPQVDREKYSVDFWENYAKLCMGATECVFDGIREALAELKSRGYLLAVLSNKKNKFVQPIISEAFGEGYFDFVCGWDEVRPKKPDPTSLLDMLAALGVEKENAWMIGDLPADYSVSVNAGINHVVADWGYGKKKKFIARGATVFAKKPIDLLDILK